MEKIQAIFLIEMLGKPKAYLQESMTGLINKLETEKGVKIIKKEFHEPTSVEGSKELLTTFTELDLEFDTIEHLLGMTFAYMPSHVEVVSPAELKLSSASLGELATALIQRLHNYDAIVKKTLEEKEHLLAKLYQVAPHLFKQGPRPAPQPQADQEPKSESVKEKKKPSKKKGKSKKK